MPPLPQAFLSLHVERAVCAQTGSAISPAPVHGNYARGGFREEDAGGKKSTVFAS